MCVVQVPDWDTELPQVKEAGGVAAGGSETQKQKKKENKEEAPGKNDAFPKRMCWCVDGMTWE